MELVSLNESVWHVNLIVNQKLNKSDLNGLAFWFILKFFIVHLNSYISVVDNAFDDEVSMLTVYFEQGVEVL